MKNFRTVGFPFLTIVKSFFQWIWLKIMLVATGCEMRVLPALSIVLICPTLEGSGAIVFYLF